MRTSMLPTLKLVITGLVILIVPASGCGTVKTSGTVRTATEQLLLTNAWDSALAQVDFQPLAGKTVFFDPQHVAAVDQGWAVSSIRSAMAAQGVLLRSKVDDAVIVVEARVGAYGTDHYNWLLGIPQMTIPTLMPGVPSGTIPEVPFAKKSHQQGLAKLALFAYDRATGRQVWNSGVVLATSSAKDLHIGGIGPIQSGTIRSGPEFVGIKLPVPSIKGFSSTVDPTSGAEPAARREESSGLIGFTDSSAPPAARSNQPLDADTPFAMPLTRSRIAPPPSLLDSNSSSTPSATLPPSTQPPLETPLRDFVPPGVPPAPFSIPNDSPSPPATPVSD